MIYIHRKPSFSWPGGSQPDGSRGEVWVVGQLELWQWLLSSGEPGLLLLPFGLGLVVVHYLAACGETRSGSFS